MKICESIYRDYISDERSVVFIGNINLALFRPAIQSSTYFDWVASKAVDGDMEGRASSTSYQGDPQPWWKVRLARPVWVTHVEITNYKKCEYSVCLNMCRQVFVDSSNFSSKTNDDIDIDYLKVYWC